MRIPAFKPRRISPPKPVRADENRGLNITFERLDFCGEVALAAV